MSEYSFFLDTPQAAWIEAAEHQIEGVVLQPRASERKMFFHATPSEQTSRRSIVPNIGSELSFVHSGISEDSLGIISTSFAQIDGKSTPIEQVIEIFVNHDFFNDIYALRETKLHLHIKCADDVTNDSDLKEESIIWFRVSLLPSAGHPADIKKQGFIERILK